MQDVWMGPLLVLFVHVFCFSRGPNRLRVLFVASISESGSMGKRARVTGFLPVFLDDTPGRCSSATAVWEVHDVTNRSSTDWVVHGWPYG